MRRSFLLALLVAAGPAAFAADLSDIETRWLKAGWPVVAFAKEQQLPLDIVVQPQAKPGDAPLAMGFVDGRCKLVLAMRGNPEAEKTLASIEPALLSPLVEAMVAHELGHCWRYVHGAWHTLPVGVRDLPADTMPGDVEMTRLRRDMRDTRREEGFAGPWVAGTLVTVLLASWILMPLSVRAPRVRSPRLATALTWAGAVCLGLFSSLFVFTVLRDAALLVAAVVDAVAPGTLPLARLVQASGRVVPAAAALVTLWGFLNARRTANV